MLNYEILNDIKTKEVYDIIKREKFIHASKIFIKSPNLAQDTINDRIKKLLAADLIIARKEKNKTIYCVVN